MADEYDVAQDDFLESINPNIFDMICAFDRASVRRKLYKLTEER
jgi:hypothetical protein